MGYDVKITGGEIIDGTGAPAYQGDVGIRDGRIVMVNGTVVRQDGRDRVGPGGPLPGRLLRAGRAA